MLCLQANQPNPYLYKCHEMGGDQEWKHKAEVMFSTELINSNLLKLFLSEQNTYL